MMLVFLKEVDEDAKGDNKWVNQDGRINSAEGVGAIVLHC